MRPPDSGPRVPSFARQGEPSALVPVPCSPSGRCQTASAVVSAASSSVVASATFTCAAAVLPTFQELGDEIPEHKQDENNLKHHNHGLLESGVPVQLEGAEHGRQT